MSLLKKASRWFSRAATDISDWTEQAAEDTADWTEQAAEDTADWIQRAVSDVGHGFNDVGEQIDRAAVDAWRAASNETNAMASAIENAGLTIGGGFVTGATVATDWLEERIEEIPEGLVAVGKYVSSHACGIALGSALTAAFVALAADGEEEVAMGGLAMLCAVETIDNLALNSLARELAFILVEPIYLIPGVNSVLGLKAEAEAFVAFLVVKACKQNPKMVVCTAGQYLAGVLIFALTAAICDGEFPGGFKIWAGGQSAIPNW